MTRDPRSAQRILPSFLVALTLLCALLPATTGASEAPDTTTTNLNEVRWLGDELIAPLPSDPGIRAAAIAEARRRNAAGQARSDGLLFGEAGPRVEPMRLLRGTSGRVVAPSVETRRAVAEIRARLRYPSDDQIVAPPTGAMPTRGTSLSQMVTGSVLTPSSGTDFDAVDDSGVDPASPDIAVGPHQIIVTTNDVVAVYDRCGNWLEGGTLQSYLFGTGGFTHYGARVIYDEWDHRWLLTYTQVDYNNNVSYYRLFVSDTDDWTDGFYFYELGYPSLIDDAFLAVDGDNIYVSFNLFDLPSFVFDTAGVHMWNKSDVYGGLGTSIWQYFPATHPEDASPIVSFRPAIMRTLPGTMYFMASKTAGDNFLTMGSFTGTPGVDPIVYGTVFLGFTYFPPDNYQQPNGSYLRTGDARLTDLVYKSGKLYGTHTEDIGGAPNVFLQQYDVGTTSFDFETSVVGAYGSVDVDHNDGLTLTYNFWNGSTFAGTRTAPLTTVDMAVGSFYPVADGQADFTRTGGGTISNPYVWGNSTGTAVDPTDNRTFWTVGAYASNDPTPSWATRVAAVSNFDAGNLVVHPPADIAFTGYEGGPFSPDFLLFDLENTGETAVHWTVSGLPAWLAASATSGVIAPGATEPLTLFLTGAAYSETASWNFNDLTFTNCSGTGGGIQQVRLIVADPGQCIGASVFLGPYAVAPNCTGGSAGEKHGAYITALRNAPLCGIGLQLDITEYQYLTARIYEASGNTRGALIAANTVTLVDIGTYMRYIPLEAYLSACEDYDIEVEFYGFNDWFYWTPGIVMLPDDPGRFVRVRSGEVGGVPDPDVPELTLVFHPTEPQGKDNMLVVPYAGGNDYTDHSTGIYFSALKTIQMTGLLFEADLVPGTQLRARLYDAAGTTRQELLAEGFSVVAASGNQYHEIPLDALIGAGWDYDIEVTFENDGHYNVGVDGGALPDTTLGGIALILAGEEDGVAPNWIPSIVLCWRDKDLGVPFDLRAPDGPYPPPFTVIWGIDNGLFITSDVDQELVSFGLYADIPQGSAITAEIYDATGTIRGSVLSTALVTSDEEGYRWHDIPVAASLQAGQDYNLHLSCSTINGQRYWFPSPPVPYSAYGTVTVNSGEQSGSEADQINEFRMNVMCGDVGTSAAPDAAAVPVPFHLAAPAPNPASGDVRFAYSLDQEGPVEMAVYDVAGRKIADVLRRANALPGSDAVSFDASQLPSGVYFLRLVAPRGTIARKFVVSH